MLIRERQENKVYLTLLQSVPGLEEWFLTSSDEELVIIAELVRCFLLPVDLFILRFRQLQKGMSGTWGDDTKSLKGAVLDWIAPKGQALQPPLSWNIKHDCGFNHEHTGALLCPRNLNWADQE